MSDRHRIVVVCIMLFLNLSGTSSSSAQIPLFADDFSAPGLAGWTHGIAGCGDTTGVWSVQGGALIFDQETCSDCEALSVNSAGWSNFTVSFDARLIDGDRLKFALPFQVGDAGAIVTISNRASDYNVCIKDYLTGVGGCSSNGNDFVDVTVWNHYELSFSYGTVWVNINGSDYDSRFFGSGVPNHGTFSILPPESIDCAARLEIDNVGIEARPPEVTLSSPSPSLVPIGSHVNLNATIKYAQSNQLNPIGYAFPGNGGAYSHTMDSENISFSLTASNLLGTAVSPQLHFYSAPPAINYFAGSPSRAYLGDLVTLSWWASGGDSVVVNPGNISRPYLQSQVMVPIESPTNYSLSLWHQGAIVDTRYEMIDVIYPTIDSFTSSKTTVIPNETFLLYWETSQADSVSISPIGFTSSELVGSTTVSVDVPTDFTLTLHYRGYETQEPLSVAIEDPRIRYFVFSSSYVLPGESSELTWNVSYADSMVIEPLGFRPTETSGSLVITPAADEEYYMTMYHGAVVDRDTTRVFVRDVAIDAFTSSHESLAAGDPLALTWDVRPDDSQVYIDDHGPFPASGELILFPTMSHLIDFQARNGTITLQETRPIEVYDPAPTAENLHLVADPLTLEPFVADIEPGVPFEVFAVVLDPMRPIGNFGFRLDLPTCMIQADVEYLTGAHSFASLPDHLVSTTYCHPASSMLVLARFELILLPGGGPSCAANPVMLTPVPTSDGTWGLSGCSGTSWYPFGHVRGIRIGGETSNVTDVDITAPPTPKGVSILGTAPNPFNPSTTIRFSSGSAGKVSVRVVDATGRSVRSEDLMLPVPGESIWTWNGLDDRGRRQASGVYFIQVHDGAARATAKVMLVK